MKISYFPPYGHSKNKIEIELDLSNCAIKFDLKYAACVHTSQYAKIDDLANLKSEVDQLHMDKLADLDPHKLTSSPVDLKKVSDAVDKKVVKKEVSKGLVKKVDVIDTCTLVKKTLQ